MEPIQGWPRASLVLPRLGVRVLPAAAGDVDYGTCHDGADPVGGTWAGPPTLRQASVPQEV